jgi:hypothetical protein
VHEYRVEGSRWLENLEGRHAKEREILVEKYDQRCSRFIKMCSEAQSEFSRIRAGMGQNTKGAEDGGCESSETVNGALEWAQKIREDCRGQLETTNTATAAKDR